MFDVPMCSRVVGEVLFLVAAHLFFFFSLGQFEVQRTLFSRVFVASTVAVSIGAAVCWRGRCVARSLVVVLMRI